MVGRLGALIAFEVGKEEGVQKLERGRYCAVFIVNGCGGVGRVRLAGWGGVGPNCGWRVGSGGGIEGRQQEWVERS